MAYHYEGGAQNKSRKIWKTKRLITPPEKGVLLPFLILVSGALVGKTKKLITVRAEMS